VTPDQIVENLEMMRVNFPGLKTPGEAILLIKKLILERDKWKFREESLRLELARRLARETATEKRAGG